MLSCYCCGQWFGDEEKLLKHLKIYHQFVRTWWKPVTPEGKLFSRCPECQAFALILPIRRDFLCLDCAQCGATEKIPDPFSDNPVIVRRRGSFTVYDMAKNRDVEADKEDEEEEDKDEEEEEGDERQQEAKEEQKENAGDADDE